MKLTINEETLGSLLNQMIGDMGAAAMAPLVVLGDRLGLYRVLAADGSMTTDQLAQKTGTTERYIREWCAAQAGSGYIKYDGSTGAFSMTPEQIAVFADPESPAYLIGGFLSIEAMAHDEPRLTEAFKTGEGIGWGDHHSCLFCGTEKFFRPGYVHNLVQSWLPALDGVVDRLEGGAQVADVGCGHGVSTMIMARAFPNSQFVGFDFHAPSVECASKAAADAGLENVRFERASAKDFPGEGYDLIAFFDCLHDMGDPVGAAKHARSALKPDGKVMLVEPAAGDALEENLNPIGRVYYAFSTAICTPASLSQEVGLALGAQAGPKRLLGVLQDGGFASARVAASTPLNLIIEGKA